MEDAGIDPATSRMLSERSTIWANPPVLPFFCGEIFQQDLKRCYTNIVPAEVRACRRKCRPGWDWEVLFYFLNIFTIQSKIKSLCELDSEVF